MIKRHKPATCPLASVNRLYDVADRLRAGNKYLDGPALEYLLEEHLIPAVTAEIEEKYERRPINGGASRPSRAAAEDLA